MYCIQTVGKIIRTAVSLRDTHVPTVFVLGSLVSALRLPCGRVWVCGAAPHAAAAPTRGRAVRVKSDKIVEARVTRSVAAARHRLTGCAAAGSKEQSVALFPFEYELRGSCAVPSISRRPSKLPCVSRASCVRVWAAGWPGRSQLGLRSAAVPRAFPSACLDPVSILFRSCLDLGHHPPAARLFALHPRLLLELFVARLQLEVGVLERFEAAEEREHLVINGALEVIPLSDFALESLQSIL